MACYYIRLYANFVPYYSNLFSPLFVFIAVIFFTSKLAGNSEIISMLASGVSFNRLLRPYMISCILIAGLTYYLNSSVIPHGTVIRLNFRSLYLNSKKNTAAENVQLKVAKNTVAIFRTTMINISVVMGSHSTNLMVTNLLIT